MLDWRNHIKRYLLLTPLLMTACSPLYVLEAAYNQSGILLRRQPIDTAISSPEATPNEVQKLSLVKEAREYAISIGLKPGDSFTKYSRVSSDVLAWVLMAARKDSFSLHTWWFPIVGSVPYKGYFDKEDAQCAGRGLERDGYETYIRGTDAFSTLGWFNDPILSTTLRHSETRIVNTVLHESLHSTVWIPGHVPFNESAANFVGAQTSIAFFQAKCRSTPEMCALAEQARLEKDREFELAAVIQKLYQDLEALYSSGKSEAQILAERQNAFDASLAPVRQRYPQMKILREINNAEIMQLKVYMTELQLFERLFVHVGKSWPKFVSALSDIADQMGKEQTDPYALLKEKISEKTL